MNNDEEKALLVKHAPVLKFDERELFFPTAVETYIATSYLVVEGHEMLQPGEVTPEHLDGTLGVDAYLKFVSDHDRRAVLKEEAKRLAGKLLGPRLGRVGLFARVLDSLFILSVVLRPTTPRLTTVAASLKADKYDLHRTPICYGRVVSEAGWLVLHYAYFYVMNDWRSGYRGLNDHEADWEQAWVYLDPSDLRPVWVAASSHEHHGADLRRHWDDPELRRDGDRPVLFVGAGSHALFFRSGDYVSRIEVPGFAWLLRARRWVRDFLRIPVEDTERGLGPAFGVPFVDAAPGNGRRIEDWDVRLLDNEANWCGSFRGLWGLDTGDPAQGERGPSGPKFKRDGQLRLSWVDPVGFAGLHGYDPPSQADFAQSLPRVENALRSLDQQIAEVNVVLPAPTPGRTGGAGARGEQQIEQMTELLRQRTELDDQRRDLRNGRLRRVGIRDHLKDPAIPIAPPRETGWLLAIWAATSVPLLLVGLAVPLVIQDLGMIVPLAIIAGVSSLLEQLVRRRFQAVLRLGLLYAALTATMIFVGVVAVSMYAMGVTLGAAAVMLFVNNLGELRALRRARQG